jgi:hypothetical protein
MNASEKVFKAAHAQTLKHLKAVRRELELLGNIFQQNVEQFQILQDLGDTMQISEEQAREMHVRISWCVSMSNEFQTLRDRENSLVTALAELDRAYKL